MNDSRFMRWMVVLWFIAFVSAGCRGAASSVPVATPVPLADWIEEGVPEDTVIYCDSTAMYKGMNSIVTILADGTVNSARDRSMTIDSCHNHGTGKISQENLKQILQKFYEVDFFSLKVDPGHCVYHVNHPPDDSLQSGCWEIDSYTFTISITINGISNSLDEFGTAPFSDPQLDNAIRELMKMCLALDRFGEPQPCTPTPPPVPSPTTSPATFTPDNDFQEDYF